MACHRECVAGAETSNALGRRMIIVTPPRNGVGHPSNYFAHRNAHIHQCSY